ncbi:MAG: OmpH family outer membrane protein [Bacteroidales bacterium]|jgi:outer membrane protein|nr:OmpH family outer membrane protein [Bacteroidales bacterium]
MNKTNVIINAIFALAIIVLFALIGKLKNSNSTTSSESGFTTVTDSSGKTVTQQFPIAYIVLDSLMRNYDYFAKREKEYTAAAEREGTKLQTQMEQIQQGMYNLQMQHQQGLITTRDAEAKGADLQKRYENLIKTQQKKELEFQQKEMELTKELRDSVEIAIGLYNNDNRFKIVLNNVFNSNVLYAEEQLNITEPVLKLMNERYQKSLTK